MTRRIAVGGENFVALRKSNSYYVDKAELLYDLFHELNNAVTLFTRPRRFVLLMTGYVTTVSRKMRKCLQKRASERSD